MSDPLDLLQHLFKPHPWHGIPLGAGAPDEVSVYIEIVPSDTVKYEIEKVSGYLQVDRPQRFSNVCPTLYGFLPQTYCGEAVAELCRRASGRGEVVGDGDPLDVCVLSERTFTHGDLLVRAKPIGGLRLIDGGEADDKIVAVLEGDTLFSGLGEIGELPEAQLDRLEHYFLTYKEPPGSEEPREVEMAEVYGRRAALEVIEASRRDYRRTFPGREERLRRLAGFLAGEER